MIKRLLWVLALTLLSQTAHAACAVTNLQVKDNAAVVAAVPYADDGSGASNCIPQVQLKAGGNVAAVKAASTAAVAADAALVVTNSPNNTVGTTQSGTWTMQPGNTANTTPWLATVNQGGNSAVVKAASTAAAAADPALVVSVSPNSTANVANVAGTALIGNVGSGVPPAGATSSNGSATGTTAATATTLAAVAAKTEYVCWISIRANATAAATGNATLSDGTKTFNFTQWTAPNANGLGVVEEIFHPCIPATAVNTAWTLTSAAAGTGGVVSVAVGGYYM